MPTSKEVEAKLQMLLSSFLEACKQEDIAKSKGVLAEIRKAILLEVQCAHCLSFEMGPSDCHHPVQGIPDEPFSADELDVSARLTLRGQIWKALLGVQTVDAKEYVELIDRGT